MALTKASFSLINGAQVNAIDFGAIGDGSGTLVGAAATGAVWNVWPSWINGDNYGTKPGHDYGDAAYLAANPPFSPSDTLDFIGIQRALWAVQTAGGGTVNLTGTDYVVNRPIRFVMPATGVGVDLVGSHFEKCKIRPLVSLAPINSIGNDIGSGVLYFYRIGLSGCNVRNLAVTTFPKNGGVPTVEFDSTVVATDWLTNGTYHACALFNNTDTVDFDNVFMSGYGEAGVVAFDQSSIGLNGLITEYQSVGVLVLGSSNCYITQPVLFSSSGTGLNSWPTTGIYLNSAKAYVLGGQISLMRKAAVASINTGNVFTIDSTTMYTEGYGGIFNCLGLQTWRVANCLMQYGNLVNDTPIILVDNTTGTLPLNPNGTGLFLGNNVASTGGVSTLDMMRLNGYNIQVIGNQFTGQSTGASASNLVINSLIGGSYSGAGTVNCLFSNNILKFFDMSEVSVFGTKQNNIDTVGNSTLVGTVYPGAKTVTAGTTINFNVTVTGVALGDIVTGVSFMLNQLTGLTVTANVTAANTVTIQLANVTAGSLSTSDELWTVMVQRKNCL
jgi:hypothetical protein